MKLMPFLVKNLPVGPEFVTLGMAADTKNTVYYDVANELKYESENYPDRLLKHPCQKRLLDATAQQRLRAFHLKITDHLDDVDIAWLRQPVKVWGRCVNGFCIHDPTKLQLYGSLVGSGGSGSGARG